MNVVTVNDGLASIRRPQRFGAKRDTGIILLMVLAMLTLFSVMVVSYVVFARQSRQSAYVVASRQQRQPMQRELLREAATRLIAGTDDPSHPFYGEDLLSDLYGRNGALQPLSDQDYLLPLSPNSYRGQQRGRGVSSLGHGFVRIPFEIPGVSLAQLEASELSLDDALAGRIITPEEGPLSGHSFRVWRSAGERSGGSPAHNAQRFSLIIELDAGLKVTLGDGVSTTVGRLLSEGPFAIATLFYDPRGSRNRVWGDSGRRSDAGGPGTDDRPYRIHINPVPLNGYGIGFDGINLNHTSSPASGSSPTRIELPLSLQPTAAVNKQQQYAIYGDFDEPYDVADFQNYFLAHQTVDRDGDLRVIPSFHRPALINYLVNQIDPSTLTRSRLRQLVMSIERSTFRPIPWAAMAATGDLPARPSINPRFTGGNPSFALSSGNLIDDPNDRNQLWRLDQLVDALINGPWDVDNDGDGLADSVWMDLGLPLVTSREGKLLRPLIAPLIEDTGGRLHLNAHGNLSQLNQQYTAPRVGPWAGGTVGRSAVQPFRGLGYGPAEIFLPTRRDAHPLSTLVDTNDRVDLLRQRYREGNAPLPKVPVAGRRQHDDLDLLLNHRPAKHDWHSGFGYSVDPWGRGGIGMHRGGNWHSTVAGTRLQSLDHQVNPPQPQIDETVNDPYETDPTGRLSGDAPYRFDELMSLARHIDWDRDVLPDRLRDLLDDSLREDPHLYRALTTRSVSMDLPSATSPPGDRSVGVTQPTSPRAILLKRFRLAFDTPARRSRARSALPILLGPELQLGQKLNVNRPFGNGIDDSSPGMPGFGVIDEPGEIANERLAFPAARLAGSASVRTAFGTASPSYHFQVPSISGRELLARNLYVLMLALAGDGYQFPTRSEDMSDEERAHHRSRKLAQWAVNVIDYRDPDSIMTRFAFDPEPFDAAGWNPPADSVVWGVEQPELIFQESMALHDVRVRDTKYENGGDGKLTTDDAADRDPHTDSIRKPEGSLFLELFNPRSRVTSADEATGVAAPPKEFYAFDQASRQYALDLGRVAPRQNGNVAMPVWRIVISKPHYPNSPPHPAVGGRPQNLNPEDSDPLRVRRRFPDSASFEIGDPEQLGSPGAPRPLAIDRVVFFRDLGSAGNLQGIVDADPDDEITDVSQIFYNYTSGPTGLLPQQYLLLAPRTSTRLGSRVFAADGQPVGPSDQRFQINEFEGLFHYERKDRSTTPDTNRLTQAALPMVIAAEPSRAWGPGSDRKLPEGIGLNVSEPVPGISVPYYPEPMFRLDSLSDAYPDIDAYVDLSDPQEKNRVPNRPVDMTDGTPIGRLTRAIEGDEAEEPFLGTQKQFCSAFLQRLADPTSPYQNDPNLPHHNPYRTVDWISIDLTVFSGEEKDEVLSPKRMPEYALGSRQRNGRSELLRGRSVLFSYETSSPITRRGYLHSASHYVSDDISGGIDADTGEWNEATVEIKQTLNYLNKGFGRPIGGPHRGLPSSPFATHGWLNRPFVTPYELLMVPATSSGRLFEDFSTDNQADPYDPGTETSTDLAKDFRAPFGHLLNFFQSHPDEAAAAQLYRLFDYVDTPPPFRGEIQAVDPRRLARTAAGLDSVSARARDWFVGLYQPPFNLTRDGRREGEINLNTVGDSAVWTGLMYGHLTPRDRAAAPDGRTPFAYQQLRVSRRGYSVTGDAKVEPQRLVDRGRVMPPPYNFAPDRLHPNYPTQFAGAFRPATFAGLAPALPGATDRLRRVDDPKTQSPVDAGVMRRRLDPSTAKPVANPLPLFVRNDPPPTWRNRDRDAFFRYQTLMRMPNLVTEQSHVFVIRLTLGYFEVDAKDLSTGIEYRSELAQQQRYRATFVIDRSLPVAFKPGRVRDLSNLILYQRIHQ